jgi:hypothetical protein
VWRGKTGAFGAESAFVVKGGVVFVGFRAAMIETGAATAPPRAGSVSAPVEFPPAIFSRGNIV